ncbi:heparinase II/III-family protein [Devosia sp.]|uniref:heparinase II/III family protein n=1 Tax=Devosia sp. TaxID=1871048 RepID=UPI001AD0602F|nr:heparinase II/III-family protein [Devosia sp.]MBN9308269.1 heparinase II/III-family protein [Devosia sp.]
MSLGWYLKRLRAMSPAELAHRVGEKLGKVVARNRLEGWARYPGAEVKPLPGLCQRVLAAATAGDREQVRQAAEGVLAGRFEALGVDWPPRQPDDLFPPEFWRLDPVTGGLWPGAERYCFDIPYRHERALGDVKYVWEANRLQFLQPLAAHALLANDGRSLAAIEAAIASWHAANPPFRGLGWNSGIELALRAISLLVVVTLVGDRLSAACRTQVGSILHASAVWLRRYPSRFSSANNHRVAELAGEFLIGLAMPGLPFARTMATRARRELGDETARQILADGVPAEQSPTYGAFTAEFVLLCASVARSGGEPFPALVGERLDAFARFIGWIQLDDGTVPAIGDDDDGRVLTLGEVEPAYPGSVANAISVYAGQGAPTAVAPDFRGLLLGRSVTRARAPQGQRLFASGGYSVVNRQVAGRRIGLVFDHAPLGYLSIAAHGHADALSITLAVDGQPVLVDPGTYLYHSGGAWRDWFRGTAAHNTLAVAGADQSIIAGAFNWSHKARARLVHEERGEPWSLTASHDGYRRRFGVLHQRSLVGTDTGFSIIDRLLGAAEGRDAEIGFQLAPGLVATRAGREVAVRRGDETVLTLAFEPGDVRIERGGEGGRGGRISPRFGVLLQADRIVWSGRVDGVGRTVAVRLAAVADRTPVRRRLEAAGG